MKNINEEQKYIRKLIARNLINKRKHLRELRNYTLYDLSKRKISKIRIDYLKKIIDDISLIDLEYSNLISYYLDSKDKN